MATAAKIVCPHIVKEPGYCGGKATIDDTCVRVNDVAWLAKQGPTPQAVLEHYPEPRPSAPRRSPARARRELE